MFRFNSLEGLLPYFFFLGMVTDETITRLSLVCDSCGWLKGYCSCTMCDETGCSRACMRGGNPVTAIGGCHRFQMARGWRVGGMSRRACAGPCRCRAGSSCPVTPVRRPLLYGRYTNHARSHICGSGSLEVVGTRANESHS